ncbi:U3 small nucleolar RNA-associated protein 4 homolog [Ptychodera flava]|uniref:U3 small nucleolar RNA-associated protein 4 homolog n=1 Tax=Ptychodera flava TaxID=63121 RepID=UPI00396A13E4
MGDFRVHHVQLFEYRPNAIHCIAPDELTNRVAVSRSDASIELWSIADCWYHEKTIPGSESRSVKALVWVNGRLFSAGLLGDITEYDLRKIAPKVSVDSIGGAVWCMTVNKSKTHIAAGMEDGCVRLFEITESGLMYDRALSKQDTRVLSLSWHDSESVIVTGSIDNIRIWNVQSGHATQRITLNRKHRNQETIVWNVCITKDFTIISTDSTGRIQFWDGQHGTLIKAYHSHRADILALCINEDEDSVYCAGADCRVIQFQYVRVDRESGSMAWVQSKALENIHSNDVRALAITKDFLVSGGVGTTLVASPVFSNKRPKSGLRLYEQRTWRNNAYPQHRQLVHIAKNAEMLMFQHNRCLEFWKLGATSVSEGKDGEVLPLVRQPIKMLLLQAKGNDHIACSAFSNCGKWAAYSDINKIRMYHISSYPPSVSKVAGIPEEVHAAHCMVFTADSSKLVIATNQCTVQVLQVDNLQPCLLHTSQPKDQPLHLLSVSQDSRWLATADNSSHINVYSLDDYQHQCSLPTLSHQPTAMAFNPHNSLLIVAYCNQKVLEYDVMQKAYTHWQLYSRDISKKWDFRQTNITQIAYSPTNPDTVFLQDLEMFAVLDKKMLTLKREQYEQAKQDGKVKGSKLLEEKKTPICKKYKPLLFMDTLKDNWLVAVQQPLHVLAESLPGSLRQKKYGT